MSQSSCDISTIPFDCLQEIIKHTDTYSLIKLRVSCKLLHSMITMTISDDLKELITTLVYYIIKILVKNDDIKIIKMHGRLQNADGSDISTGLFAWFKIKTKNGDTYIKMGEGEERNKHFIDSDMTTDQEVQEFIDLILQTIEENKENMLRKERKRQAFSKMKFDMKIDDVEILPENITIKGVIVNINEILNDDIKKSINEFIKDVGIENIQAVIYDFRQDYLPTSEVQTIMNNSGELATDEIINKLKLLLPPPPTYPPPTLHGGNRRIRRVLKRCKSTRANS